MNEVKKKGGNRFFLYLFLILVIALTIVVKLDVKTPVTLESVELPEIQEKKVAKENTNPLLGTWKGATPSGDDQYINFLDEKNLVFIDDNGSSNVEYETITEVEPNQLYIYIQGSAGKQRIPFGIFKIEGDTLLWRDSIETYRDSQSLPDFEMPTDFSQNLIKFSRSN